MEVGEKIMINNYMSITKIGVTAAIFLFVTIAGYFLLSNPIEIILDSFDDADFAHAEDEMNTYMSTFRNALTLFWAVFLSLPLTWLIMKVLTSRETAFNNMR
jgi:hypothetical protein